MSPYRNVTRIDVSKGLCIVLWLQRRATNAYVSTCTFQIEDPLVRPKVSQRLSPLANLALLNLSSLLPLGHLYPRTVCRGHEGTHTGTGSALPPALLSNPKTPMNEANFPFWGNETLGSCKLQVRLAAVLHRKQSTWLSFFVDSGRCSVWCFSSYCSCCY